MACGALLLVAAPALAVIAPWQPTLQRPGIDNPVTVDSSPVVESARDALAVLRRPQTPADREQTASLLSVVGTGNQVDHVQTDGIRAVAKGWALVPAKSVKTGPAQASPDMLCLTNGQGIGCSPASSVSENGLGIVSASSTRTKLSAIVPDGVAAVRVTPAGGTPIEANVTSNFYSVSIPQTAPPRTIAAPPGYKGGPVIQGPPVPVHTTVEWLDASRKVIGPRQQNGG